MTRLIIISDARTNGGHAEYQISIDGSTIKLWKRYRQFDALAKQLKEKTTGVTLSIPPKRWGRGTAPSVVTERKKGLEQALNQAIASSKDSAAGKRLIVEFLDGEDVFSSPNAPVEQPGVDNVSATNYVHTSAANLEVSQGEDPILRAKMREVVETFVRSTQQRGSKSKEEKRNSGGTVVEETPFDAELFKQRLRDVDNVFVALTPEKDLSSQ